MDAFEPVRDIVNGDILALARTPRAPLCVNREAAAQEDLNTLRIISD